MFRKLFNSKQILDSDSDASPTIFYVIYNKLIIIFFLFF